MVTLPPNSASTLIFEWNAAPHEELGISMEANWSEETTPRKRLQLVSYVPTSTGKPGRMEIEGTVPQGSYLISINDLDVTAMDMIATVRLLQTLVTKRRSFTFASYSTQQYLQVVRGNNIEEEDREFSDKLYQSKFRNISFNKDIAQISCGKSHCLIRTRGGEAYSFGSGSCGKLGTGSEHSTLLPTAIRIKKITQVACGRDHSIIITSTGSAFGFGWNEAGRLGLGVDSGAVLVPTRIRSNNHIKAAACGSGTNGKVYYCGIFHGIPVTHNPVLLLSPTLVLAPASEIKAIACGNAHSVLQSTKGDVYTFGDAQSGALGRNDNDTSVPKLLMSSVREISCGPWQTICIDEYHKAWAWGDTKRQDLISENVRNIRASNNYYAGLSATDESTLYEWNSQKKSVIVQNVRDALFEMSTGLTVLAYKKDEDTT